MNTARHRRTRTLAWGALPLLLLTAALSVDHIPLADVPLTVPYAAEGPGPTVDTLGEVEGIPVVDVRAPEVDTPAGQLRMTTVSVRTNMTLPQLIGRWLTTDDTIVPAEQIFPKGATREEIEEANKAAFSQSESAATVAAMDWLHLPVKTVIADVIKDSPAQGHIRPDDVLLQVDGKRVAKPGQAQELIAALAPGDQVELLLERDGKEITVRPTLGENEHDPGKALLGVYMAAHPVDDIEVSYNLQDVGGPSAGMMFTLAVIDKLTPGDLTGGHVVAGTGTIDPDGTVGPIGGIVHKARAARDAGTELFLSPSDNCAEVLSRDTGNMVVAAVDTLDDAVTAIESFAKGEEVRTCGSA
ncbi:PDZ domain-containing protein [Corynebacterium lizhenjunii]|uniref:endopeptidase La n=1 Tax=Corynebacterium lizhenjunii TaxID=2709394 RepID=A0A7T0KGB0_9CORY|nr:PDZ domain-containing protein [Corynebacterium lizhenjunii]QPK79720.1 PDZ domain-containing protein [Corynebacterium lizhenjunii]